MYLLSTTTEDQSVNRDIKKDTIQFEQNRVISTNKSGDDKAAGSVIPGALKPIDQESVKELNKVRVCLSRGQM